MDRKNEFLKTLSANRTAGSILKRVSKYELKFNKDACDFTKEEIEEMYKEQKSTSAGSLNVVNSYFKQYTAWCISNNMSSTNTNNYEGFKIDDLAEFIDTEHQMKSIISVKELDSICNELNNPSDEFIIRAIFEGIDTSELVYLTKDDIGEGEWGQRIAKLKVIDGKARTTVMSNGLYILALKSAQTNEYINRDGVVKKMAGPDNLIIKEISKISDNDGTFFEDKNLASMRQRRINDRATRILRKTSLGSDYDITPKSLRISGMINYINTNSKILGITGEQFLSSEHINDLTSQFGCTLSKVSFIRAYKRFLNDCGLTNESKMIMSLFKEDLQYAHENGTGFSRELSLGEKSGAWFMIESDKIEINDKNITIEYDGGKAMISVGAFDTMTRTIENGFTVYKYIIGEKKTGENNYDVFVFPFVRE